MTDLVTFNPQEIEHAAHAISAVTHAVPGLYQALYETIGLFWTDPIKRKRREKNLKAEFEMAEEMIKGKKRLDDISATLAKEVLEPAMEEDREELQKIWAALLARLMTDELSVLRSEWIDIIKGLEPIDVGIFEFLKTFKNTTKQGDKGFFIKCFSEKFKNEFPQTKYEESDFWLSFQSLVNKSLLFPVQTIARDKDGTWSPAYIITPLGNKIVEITSPPTSE
ncbi:hypothetical protein [Acetobacter orientalis]|uniref:Abi-alpha family protein n=1 Tax=Acetobacter orientalis TaxID=146474 RepID=UPI0039EC82F3